MAKKRKPLGSTSDFANPKGFPGDNIREFLEEVNARWGDIDEALAWFAANKAAIADIIKVGGKIAAFVDVLLDKDKVQPPNFPEMERRGRRR